MFSLFCILQVDSEFLSYFTRYGNFSGEFVTDRIFKIDQSLVQF